ncbi:MAG TPA: hypothetical protein VFP37_14345 [Steroidobacteraceae bacterium]|nr:hypothetical protein [Steroidobacteraceae bacterium]
MNRIALGLATVSLVLLGGCDRQERVREVDWAKAALARNPALEILATDESAGEFTVRDTSTGATQKLRLEDLVAGPAPAKVTAQPAAPAAETAAPAPDESSAAPDEAPGQTTESVAAVPEGDGHALAEGPGYRISRGAAAEPPATLEGPGYSITREGPPPTGQSAPRAEAIVAEKRTEPIICQGDRLMRIDGENIDFTGDAVIAEKGCDLYISNARIRAGGVGIIARQARVHIVNSTIGGSRGSYEASDGAEIYVARSTFSGIGRRFDNATMNDLGGNEYRLTH